MSNMLSAQPIRLSLTPEEFQVVSAALAARPLAEVFNVFMKIQTQKQMQDNPQPRTVPATPPVEPPAAQPNGAAPPEA